MERKKNIRGGKKSPVQTMCKMVCEQNSIHQDSRRITGTSHPFVTED